MTEAPPEERITMADLKATGHCASGIRRWADANGVDLRGYLARMKNGGIPVSEFPQEDAFVQQLLKVKRGTDGPHGG